MRSVTELDLPDQVIDLLTEEWGISRLHPPQAEAMPFALSGRNLLLAIPTASGKSLVAYLAICRRLLVDEIGSRAIYIVPLKALASEKMRELSELGEACGLKVGLAIGDSSREVQRLDDADILICTSEKLDSLARTRPDVLRAVSTVVADEVHLVNERSRGPTMEINLARLMLAHPEAQIIALSATIGNPQKMARWLDAELITSDWRPVPLQYATLAETLLEVRHLVSPEDAESELPAPRRLNGPKSHVAWCAFSDTIEDGGQLLVFVSTRRSAESEARKLGDRNAKGMDEDRRSRLAELSNRISAMTDSAMGDRLAGAVRGGVAFHHAGLTHDQRKAVEEAFKEGLLQCLTATPTLAAGVNLPARRVLVRDLKRWEDGMSGWISNMEVAQMMGRAGRPGHDDRGDAWLVCKGEDPVIEADSVADRYIHGDPEPVISRLAAEPPLRVHLLSFIAGGGVKTRTDIRRFFSATFLSHTQDAYLVDERIDSTLHWLADEGFIKRCGIDDSVVDEEALDESEEWDDDTPSWVDSANATEGVQMSSPKNTETVQTADMGLGFHRAADLPPRMVKVLPESEVAGMRYEATGFGQRVSQLYLDPLSATILRKGSRKALELSSRGMQIPPFSLLHLVSATPDFLILWPRRDRAELYVKQAMENETLLWSEGLEDVELGLIQSAWTLERWIEEDSVRNIEKEMKVAPGDLRTRIDLMQWLLYSARELILHDDVEEEMAQSAREIGVLIDRLRRRVDHGCREELLNMVAIPNIGRGRARDLFGLGLENPREILELTEFDRSRLLALKGWGPKVLERAMRDVKRMR